MQYKKKMQALNITSKEKPDSEKNSRLYRCLIKSTNILETVKKSKCC